MAVKINRGAATTVSSLGRGASSKPNTPASQAGRPASAGSAYSPLGDAVVASVRSTQSSQTEIKIRDPIEASERAQDIAEQIRNDAELLDEVHRETDVFSPAVEILR